MPSFRFALMTWSLAIFTCCCAFAAEVEERVKAHIGAAEPHPRLLMTAEDERRVRTSIAENATKAALFEMLRAKADEMLGQPPVIREKQGRRMLFVSREALQRIFYLSTVYRLTDEMPYAQRAIQEMEAAAAFTDWNPSHFLDVAEMTTALAIGYDWLHAVLTPDQERIIRQAILEKGIGPSYAGHDSWVYRNNNWNQVCHGGMIFGALALLEQEPELAARVVSRALDGLPHAIAEYKPDGVYVEGPSYWEYGTTYNVLAIAALESALGTDFGLTEYPGFRETGAFPLYMTGPTGDHFTFGDCWSRKGAFPAVYWFARRWNDQGLFYLDHRWLKTFLDGEASLESRFLPLLLLWWDGRAPQAPKQPLHWRGDGLNPIAIHRSSWTDRDGLFLAIKGGTPSANHGHMDIGSFVLEMEGVRWSVDIMGRGYGDLEAMGLDIWNRSQDSDRWRVYRYHNSSHSTLVVNGESQVVSGRAPITAFSSAPEFPHTVLDMRSVYEGQLIGASRGFALLSGGRVLIQDELDAGEAPARVRWAMTTPALLAEKQDSEAILTHQDKFLKMQVLSPENMTVESLPTDTPNDWDVANPNIRQVGFHATLEPGASATIAVVLTPGGAVEEELPPVILQPLERWGKP